MSYGLSFGRNSKNGVGGLFTRLFPCSDGEPPYLCIKYGCKTDRGARPLRTESRKKAR
jgi:hypothetical protein